MASHPPFAAIIGGLRPPRRLLHRRFIAWVALSSRPRWIGILMIVPVLNLLVGYYIAFADTGRFVA